MNNNTKKTSLILSAVVVFMFFFSYMLVPLYEVFCDITGLNGKTNKTKVSVVENPINRFVTIKFTSNVANSAPLEFLPMEKEIRVKPGKIYTTSYLLSNTTNRKILTTSNPSVVPGQFADHFKKIECFCFSHQEINSKETKELPIQFIVDNKLPANIKTLVLSYTIYDISEQIGFNLENNRYE